MDGRNGMFTHAFSESSSKLHGKNGLARRDTVDPTGFEYGDPRGMPHFAPGLYREVPFVQTQ